jgi:hypothetical protein
MDKQVKENISAEGNLIKLVFHRNDDYNQPTWTKEGKEFCYKNDMYDIAKIVANKDSIVYYCLKDKDENNLFETFLSLLKNSMGNDKKNQGDYSKELSKYDLAHKDIFTKTHFMNIIYASITSYYKSMHIQIDSPPPRLV